ncbi:pilus assembly protein [Stenotrophomonas sp. TWI700]|uniref:pilus assembly protein n=1 Tax=Stenotrophomonas sp. TWI700 TaxID=3136792 RepID=UPI003209F780
MKPTVCLYAALGALGLLMTASAAHANLTVHPMRMAVEHQRGAQVRVYSQSAQTQYVQATIKRIVDPATDHEAEVDIEPGQLDAIAVTPGKFALAGGGNRLVRVIPLSTVTRETAYRVYFEGVRGDADETSMPAEDGPAAQVGLSLIWGTLVHVLPADPLPDMRLDGAALHNTGNLRLGVTTVERCVAKNQCESHDIQHSIYPGQQLELPFTATSAEHVRVHYRLSHAGYRLHERELQP